MPSTKIGSGDGFGRDQFPHEDPFDDVEQRQRRRLVVVDVRALAGIAGREPLERTPIIVEIEVGLAEREIELPAMHIRQAVVFGGKRLHREKLMIAG
jgi:hypothetical protein